MHDIKVAIYDDNDDLRDSIVLLLENAARFTVFGSWPNCLHLKENLAGQLPDVIIMDIDMDGKDGIEGVKEIRQHFPAVHVLMLTVFDNDEKVFAAIRAGANGYILKNAEPRLLLDAIVEVCHGGAPMTPGIARKVLLQFQQLKPELAVEDFHLSQREKEVLSLLVSGLSYKMIGSKLKITYDTVRAHMKKIYEKLHVTSMTEAVAKAIHQKILPPR